jgi:hypothetical protein
VDPAPKNARLRKKAKKRDIVSVHSQTPGSFDSGEPANVQDLDHVLSTANQSGLNREANRIWGQKRLARAFEAFCLSSLSLRHSNSDGSRFGAEAIKILFRL